MNIDDNSTVNLLWEFDRGVGSGYHADIDFHPAPRACYCLTRAPLAQLVEQLTLNQRVRGSKP